MSLVRHTLSFSHSEGKSYNTPDGEKDPITVTNSLELAPNRGRVRFPGLPLDSFLQRGKTVAIDAISMSVEKGRKALFCASDFALKDIAARGTKP